MWYAIISRDVDDSRAARTSARQEHIARLQELVRQGRLMIAGPHPAIDSEEPGEAGFTGSLVIADFESLDAAKEWADADPYVASGAYSEVIVKPFKRVLP